MVRIGNFELTGEHYRWIADPEIVSESLPEWGMVVERLAWGRFYGKPKGFVLDGKPAASTPAESWALFEKHHDEVRARWRERRDLETSAMGRVNADLEAGAPRSARGRARERGRVARPGARPRSASTSG